MNHKSGYVYALTLLRNNFLTIKNKTMKIFVIEKVKPGTHKELTNYESDFVPSIGDIMASSLFTDLEHRIVVERMIIPTTNTVMLYCNPPSPTKFNV